MFIWASDYFIGQLISKVIQSWISCINKDDNTGYNDRFTVFKFVHFLWKLTQGQKCFLVIFNFLRATTSYKFSSIIYSTII